MDMFDLAGALFGNRANPVAQGPSLTATGSTASADGVAGITFDGDVTPAEGVGEDVDQTVIDLPTSPDVAEGDEVIVTLVGDGPLKTPIVTANPGSGDRMAAAVTEAHDLAASVEGIAQEAKEVAEATGQHFWPDDDGVHVTEVTQDEWNDAEGPSYHSGANVLLNALGQLFRDGLNNLLALLPGTATTYTETFTDLSTGEFELAHTPTRVISVEVDGAETDFYTTTGNIVTVLFLQSSDQEVAITYKVGGSAIAIYDGEGNDAGNITATFGEGGATIGYVDEGHIELTKDFVRIMEGARQTAKLGNGQLLVGDDSDPALLVSRGFIYFYPTMDDVQSLYFGEQARIQRPTNGTLRVSSDVGLILSGPNLTFNSTAFTMSHVIDMLTTASATLTRGSGASSWSSGQVRRSGKVVVVSVVNMKLATALASNANSPAVTTVPAGYRPNVLQRVPVALAGSAGNYANVWAVVGGGGGVQIHNGSGLSIPTTMELSLNCTYIVD